MDLFIFVPACKLLSLVWIKRVRSVLLSKLQYCTIIPSQKKDSKILKKPKVPMTFMPMR